MLDSAEHPAQTTIGPAQERAERQARVLARLVDIQMELSEILLAQAASQHQADAACPGLKPTLQAGEIAAGVERLARSVRLTLTLEQKLADGSLTAELEAREKRRLREAERRDEAQLHKSAAFKATREVIKQSDRPECERERLLDTADGLFIHGDLPAELFERGLHSGLMADICKVLGVEPDWAVWSGESWALTEMIASLPGPYQHWRTNALKPDGTRGVAPPEQPAPDFPDSS
jgi:hypothetical protein